MLSIHNIASASGGASYYMKTAEYYQGEGEREKPELQGKNIQDLVGTGELSVVSFTRLLNGELPNGKRLGKSEGEGINHRPGVDLTFSAPKSLSILALVSGKSELANAHNRAVTETLHYAEKYLAFSRVNGKLSQVDNLNTVKFYQTTSRENDPQIHTHCVVLNAVHCEDGKWRCMETGAIYDSKMMLGQMYRLILARILVNELGYDIEVNKKDGTFEIKGVSKEINQLFSKRSEQIKEVSEKAGITSAVGLASITKNTRKKAMDLPPEELLKKWKQELESFGLKLPDINADPNRKITQANKIKIAQDAVSTSIKKLDSFMRFYAREEVIFHAMVQSADKLVCPEEMCKAFDREVKRNGLIPITQDKRLYISGETYKAEGGLRTIAQKSWDMRHLHIGDRVKHVIYGFVLNRKSTVDSLAKALNSSQLISIVDNFSPVHDEKSLSRILKISRAFGKDTQVVSISSVDRENLYSAGVISCGFTKYIKEQATRDGVVLVYGAEKLTMQQMEKLAKSASLTNSKIVLLNAKDNTTVDSRYSPVDYLAVSGIKRVEIRSKAELALAGVNILNRSEPLIEIKNLKELAEHFTSKEARLIISSNPQKLNAVIRELMIHQGRLGVDIVTVNNYTHKHMTDIELNRSVNYKAGDILKIESLSILGAKLPEKIAEGDHFKIVFSESNILVVEHEKLRKQFKIDLDKIKLFFGDVSLYKARQLELRVGDRIILPKDNIYGKRYLNQIGTVESITRKAVSINLGGERNFELYHENGKPSFLERAWAVPAHRRVEGWKGKLDLHLSPESVKNVLKNLPNAKIARLEYVYMKDRESIIKTIDQMGSKIDFISTGNTQIIVENTKGENIAEITREIKQTPEDRERLAYNAVGLALKKITEKEYAFTREDVLRESGSIAVGGLGFDEVSSALDKRIASGSIIEVGKHNGLTTFTTKEMSDKRDSALRKIDREIVPICSKVNIHEKFVELKRDIPPEHMKVVEGLLISNRAISIVQGYAGTAKTSLTLKNYAQIAKSQGYEIKGFAPTHSACLELKNKAGIDARTVESVMQEIHKRIFHINNKSIVIVDESSMLSVPDMVILINTCTTKGTKLVLVGDQNQQPSVGAGEIFRELVNNKQSDVHYIREILRQKTPEYRGAIQSLAKGDVPAFFESMKESFVEVKGKGIHSVTHKEITGAISHEYVSIAKSERDFAQIITLTNDARHEINRVVRGMLIDKKDLSVESVSINTYQSQDHANVTKHFSSTLVEGDVIRFNQPDERYSIHAAEYLTIASISDKDNSLKLVREDGETLGVRPDQSSLMSRGGIEVYKQEKRELAVGEKIIFRRSIDDAGVLNTDMGKVAALDGSVATINFKDRILQLDLSKPENRHWDYGYAITSHVFQGKDCETVLCHFDTRSKPLANYQSFYVAVTRGEYSMKVFTDSIEGAQKTVLESYLEKNLAYEPVKKDLPISRNEPRAPLLERQERIVLGQSAALICKTIMGEPFKTRGSTLYYGAKNGSMRIETAGEKAGLWNDFAAGEGGDIIDLIKCKTGNDFRGSVELARNIIGERPEAHIGYSLVQNTPVEADNTSRIEKARVIFDSGILIRGTPGEKYLHEHRAIPLNIIDRSVSEIRYIPDFRFDSKPDRKFSAVAFAARNGRGDIQAVQVVLIDPKTGSKLPGQCKYSFGVMKGSTLNLGKQGGEVYIAEGPETALSIFAAKPDADVRAAFSAENIKNAFIPLSTSLAVICADNDGVGAPSEKAIAKAIELIKGEGISVSMVMPPEKGQDFNDLIKEGGRTQIIKALLQERKPLKMSATQHTADQVLSI